VPVDPQLGVKRARVLNQPCGEGAGGVADGAAGGGGVTGGDRGDLQCGVLQAKKKKCPLPHTLRPHTLYLTASYLQCGVLQASVFCLFKRMCVI
jgi:hypothetical protein